MSLIILPEEIDLEAICYFLVIPFHFDVCFDGLRGARVSIAPLL